MVHARGVGRAYHRSHQGDVNRAVTFFMLKLLVPLSLLLAVQTFAEFTPHILTIHVPSCSYDATSISQYTFRF